MYERVFNRVRVIYDKDTSEATHTITNGLVAHADWPGALLGQVLYLALCDLAELSPELKCERAYG